MYDMQPEMKFAARKKNHPYFSLDRKYTKERCMKRKSFQTNDSLGSDVVINEVQHFTYFT
jgi:hypothetical protein